MNGERESNFELLRLFCIFGIVYMHSFGSLEGTVSPVNIGVTAFINSIFDAGVTCFILISGYFGIKFNVKKLVSLAMMVLFYSLAGVLVTYGIGETMPLEDLVKSFVPVLSRKYWFITCYFWLAALAPFLNKIPENLERKSFKNLLLVLLILFSAIPTFLYFEIMQDSGRGMAHMILIYLLGRYIRIYGKPHYIKKNLFILLSSSILFTFLINYALTMLSGQYFAPFVRNCSLTIIITSGCMFLLFREVTVKNRMVNIIAGGVLAVYVFERTIRTILGKYVINISDFSGEWYLFVVVAGYTAAVMAICLVLEWLRKGLFKKLEIYIGNKLEKIFIKVCRIVNER